MQTIIFRKKVSKGSRFNQIYVPKYLEDDIGVGDEVEVRLIKKHAELYYSKGLKELSGFKERLIKDVFSFLSRFDNILNIFLVGSFLFRKIDYGDIDIVIITENKIRNFDELVYNQLTNKFNLKFHILSIEKKRFESLLKACPLTRAMFNIYISDKRVSLERKKIIDNNHLRFLLMMPEDLLEIRLNNRIFFDNLRRLITIERFLYNKRLNLDEINSELRNLMGARKYERMKNNEEIEEGKIKDIREIMKIKIKKINEMIQGGEKG
ncbi:hypothetical protein KY366_01205 [Candidatus Woesearchaeota archaeon]|nr:hypothetical protein [Candidatus Woesearchaeota archaeon]